MKNQKSEMGSDRKICSALLDLEILLLQGTQHLSQHLVAIMGKVASLVEN